MKCASIGYFANIVLWKQSGYFAGEAELKPLLHIWSLSLEEQYYLILPLLLISLPRRAWFRVISALILASLTVYFLRAGKSSTFYLLPTRAWELGLGSIAALLPRGVTTVLARARHARWSAVVAMTLGLTAFREAAVQPFSNLTVCVATFVLLLIPSAGVSSKLGTLLEWFGDRSYSLYLVHWPIFAAINNSWLGAVSESLPWQYSAAALVVSLAFAHLLYSQIERPLHVLDVNSKRPWILSLSAASILVVLATHAIARDRMADGEFAARRQPNFGLSRECDEKGERFNPNHCTIGAPDVLVWGDSYGMHLVPGIIAERPGAGLLQATKSMCGPLLNLAPLQRGEYDRLWASRCLTFNRSVLRFIAQHAEIKTVVLASAFYQYLSDADSVLRQTAQGEQVVSGSVQATEVSLEETIDSLVALKKKVVVVAPPPYAGFDVGRCLERADRGMLILGNSSSCRITRRVQRVVRPNVEPFLRGLKSTPRVAILDLSKFFCNESVCASRSGNVYIYRDAGHFSVEGSRWIAARAKIASSIWDD